MKNEWSIGRGIAVAGKWLAIALIITILFTSTLKFINNRLTEDCYYNEPLRPIIGGETDAYGCYIMAGYTWNESQQECVREWEK